MTAVVNVENLLHGGRSLVGFTDQGEYVAGWPEVARGSIRAINHLTGHGPIPAPTVYRILGELKDRGVKNILALRGDLAEGETLKDFHYASDLVKFIRQGYDFNVYGACYPEKHIEAVSMEDDLRHLKEKVDCGVNALISQLFFDNNSFYEFRSRARALGITCPIEAGIMPITSAKQISRMVSMCGATVPDRVQRFIKAYGHNSMAMKEAGVAYATEQIVDLLATGVDGIHIYTMNLPSITKRIAENIRGILYALRVKRG